MLLELPSTDTDKTEIANCKRWANLLFVFLDFEVIYSSVNNFSYSEDPKEKYVTHYYSHSHKGDGKYVIMHLVKVL